MITSLRCLGMSGEFAKAKVETNAGLAPLGTKYKATAARNL